MANFLAVSDPIEERRARTMARAREVASPVDGLAHGDMEHGIVSVTWACGITAPVSVHASGSEGGTGACLVIGDALPRGESARVTARTLLTRLHDHGSAPDLDGYHVVVAPLSDGTLRIGADVLGVFPVYWARPAPEVLLVSSSPELMRAHPLFRAEVDSRALAGILLTHGLVANAPLVAGTRRLPAGHWLLAPPSAEPREVPHHVLRTRAPEWDRDPTGLARALEERLAGAVERHSAAWDEGGVLLSGGLDSRLLAGLLTRVGRRWPALTLGRRGQHEFACAAKVARELDLRHRLIPTDPTAFARAADRKARWEQLSNGFSSLGTWALTERGDLPPAVLSGYLVDAAIGFSHTDWARDPASGRLSDERYLASVCRWGFSEHDLDAMATPSFHGIGVAPTVARLRSEYVPDAPQPEQRYWMADILHRQRYHVGGSLWPLSFVSWPIVPVLDHDLLDFMGGLPADLAADRQLQVRMLKQSFERLSRLPVDRVTDVLPLEPTARDFRRSHRRRAVRNVVERLGFGGERAYYRSVYDLDGPVWTNIRDRAESGRPSLEPWLDPGATETALPRPGRRLGRGDPIVDGGGPRMLLGAMLVLPGLAS